MYTHILFNRAIPQHILAISLELHSIHSSMALYDLFNNTGLPLLAVYHALIYSTKLFQYKQFTSDTTTTTTTTTDFLIDEKQLQSYLCTSAEEPSQFARFV
jgi:hypothetical protein